MTENILCHRCLKEIEKVTEYGYYCEDCYLEKLNEDAIRERDEPYESGGDE